MVFLYDFLWGFIRLVEGTRAGRVHNGCLCAGEPQDQVAQEDWSHRIRRIKDVAPVQDQRLGSLVESLWFECEWEVWRNWRLMSRCDSSKRHTCWSRLEFFRNKHISFPFLFYSVHKPIGWCHSQLEWNFFSVLVYMPIISGNTLHIHPDPCFTNLPGTSVSSQTEVKINVIEVSHSYCFSVHPRNYKMHHCFGKI